MVVLSCHMSKKLPFSDHIDWTGSYSMDSFLGTGGICVVRGVGFVPEVLYLYIIRLGSTGRELAVDVDS